MDDTEFSAGFCSFIKAAIPSVDAAELLLLFHSSPGVPFAPDEAAAKLGHGMEPHETATRLEAFESDGLLSKEGGLYRYRANPKFSEFVETLAQAYRERPVTLVRIIYALRDSSIQSFSDAFKLKRK